MSTQLRLSDTQPNNNNNKIDFTETKQELI